MKHAIRESKKLKRATTFEDMNNDQTVSYGMCVKRNKLFSSLSPDTVVADAYNISREKLEARKQEIMECIIFCEQNLTLCVEKIDIYIKVLEMSAPSLPTAKILDRKQQFKPCKYVSLEVSDKTRSYKQIEDDKDKFYEYNQLCALKSQAYYCLPQEQERYRNLRENLDYHTQELSSVNDQLKNGNSDASVRVSLTSGL